MADGATALRRQIAKLRELSKLASNSAPAVARAIKAEISAQVARGEGPDGRPWKLTKVGKQPLVNAARAISTSVSGTTIVLRLAGHHARHHFGAVRGKIKRRILPSKRIPDPVTRAIARVIAGEFRRTMSGES